MFGEIHDNYFQIKAVQHNNVVPVVDVVLAEAVLAAVFAAAVE